MNCFFFCSSCYSILNIILLLNIYELSNKQLLFFKNFSIKLPIPALIIISGILLSAKNFIKSLAPVRKSIISVIFDALSNISFFILYLENNPMHSLNHSLIYLHLLSYSNSSFSSIGLYLSYSLFLSEINSCGISSLFEIIKNKFLLFLIVNVPL